MHEHRLEPQSKQHVDDIADVHFDKSVRQHQNATKMLYVFHWQLQLTLQRMDDDPLQIMDALMQLVIALNVEGTALDWLLLHILVLARQVDGVLADEDRTIAT